MISTIKPTHIVAAVGFTILAAIAWIFDWASGWAWALTIVAIMDWVFILLIANDVFPTLPTKVQP